jgi:transcriptional regulator with XRE-family HTH domain
MSKSVVQRQRIGPQIRHLRQMRGLTLDELAAAGGLSASHLSRLERSQTLPSFTVLANIAQVLGVSIDEFVQLEHDLQELDEQLAWQAELLSLDENAYREILGLSIDTRRQLNSAIEILSNGRLTSVVTQEETSAVFHEHNSLADAWSDVRDIIRRNGLNPVGLSRALVQLLEIPGNRYGVLTAPGLLASTPNVEYSSIYRALCPTLPLDPSAARNWRNWHSMANEQFPFDWQIRVIAHRDLLDRIRERFAGSGHVDADKLVADIAEYWSKMLETSEHFELAVVENKIIDGNVFIGGDAATLFERHAGSSDSADEPVGLWVSSHSLVQPVVATVTAAWNDLTEHERDRGQVCKWLETYHS